MAKRTILVASLIALLLGSGGVFVWSQQRSQADVQVLSVQECFEGEGVVAQPETRGLDRYVGSFTVSPDRIKPDNEATISLTTTDSPAVYNANAHLNGGYTEVAIQAYDLATRNGAIIDYSPKTITNGEVINNGNHIIWRVTQETPTEIEGASNGRMDGGQTYSVTVKVRVPGQIVSGDTVDQFGIPIGEWEGVGGRVTGSQGHSFASTYAYVARHPLELSLRDPTNFSRAAPERTAQYVRDLSAASAEHDVRFAVRNADHPARLTIRTNGGTVIPMTVYNFAAGDIREDLPATSWVARDKNMTRIVKIKTASGQNPVEFTAEGLSAGACTTSEVTAKKYLYTAALEPKTLGAQPSQFTFMVTGPVGLDAFFQNKKYTFRLLNKYHNPVDGVQFSVDNAQFHAVREFKTPLDPATLSQALYLKRDAGFTPVAEEYSDPGQPSGFLDRLLPRAQAGVGSSGPVLTNPNALIEPIYLEAGVDGMFTEKYELKLSSANEVALSVDGAVAQHDPEQEATINLKVTKKDTTDVVSNESVTVKILNKDDGSAAPEGLELKDATATTFTKPPEVVVTTDDAGVATLKARAKDLSLEDAKNTQLIVRSTLADGSSAEADLAVEVIELDRTARRTTPEQRFTPVGLDTEADPLPEVEDPDATPSPTATNSGVPQANGLSSSLVAQIFGVSRSRAAEPAPTPVTGRAVKRVYPGDVFEYELTATVGRGHNELAVTQENRDLVEPNVTEEVPLLEAIKIYVNGQLQPTSIAGDDLVKELSVQFNVDETRDIKPGDEVRVVFPYRVKQLKEETPPSDDAEPPLDDVRTFSLAGAYIPDSGKKIDVKPVEIEYIARTFLETKVSQIAHREPESGALGSPVTYTADEPVFPGDRLYYEVTFRAPKNFEPKGYTLWSEWTKYAEFGGFGEGFSAHTKVDNEKHTIEWDLAQLMEGGLLRAGRLSYFVDLNAEITGATADDEGNTPQLDIQTSFNIYDDQEIVAIVVPQIVTTPLWTEVTGELKTYLDEPWPYVTVYTHPDAASFRINEADELSWVSFEERTHPSRTRTDVNGQYTIRVPRAELGAKEVEVNEGETRRQFSVKIEYLDDFLPEGINPHYDYWFVFEDNQQPIVIKSELAEVTDVRAQQINFDFSEVDPSGLRIFGRELEDRALTKVALAGTVALRAASQAKNFMETSARVLAEDPSSPVLGQLKLRGLTRTGPDWWSSGLAYTTPPGNMITIGPAASDVTDVRFQEAFEALIYHEFGHHVHGIALWPNLSPSSYPTIEQLTELSALGLPYLFQPDVGLYDSHRGIRHPNTYSSYREGFADFASIFFLRKFERSSNDDWTYPAYSRNDPADYGGIGPPHLYVDYEDTQQILPIFAGYANNPHVTNRSANASPVVVTPNTEENAIRNFLSILLRGETAIDSSAAWWVGTPEAVTTLNTPLLAGGDEAERFIRLLGIAKTAVARDSEGRPIVTFPILAQAIAAELDTVEPLLKLVGLFEDRDCDFTYDEQLIEKLGDSGSFCNFVLRGGGLSSITDLSDRNRQSPTALLAPRPWRDELWSQSTPSNSGVGYSTVEEAGPMIEVTIPGADTHQVTIAHTLPSGRVWQQTRLVSGTQELPLNLYPPVIPGLTRVTVEGSSDVLDLDSRHIWRGYLSEAPISVVARKTFILDGGNALQSVPYPPAPFVDEEPLLPGQCRIENDQVVECRDRDNRPLVGDQIPPEARRAAAVLLEEAPPSRDSGDRSPSPSLPTYSRTPSDYTASLVSGPSPVTLAHGESATLEVQLRNTGSATWYQGVVRLASDRPADRVSIFDPGAGWERCNRAQLVESSVAPGQVGTFRLTITATTLTPPGTYREHFRPVVDGVTWLDDLGILADITVTAGSSATSATASPTHDRDPSHYHAALVSQSAPPTVTRGQSTTLEVTLRNTGTATWRKGVVRLASDRPADRVSVFDPSGTGWERCNRIELVEASVAPGATGTFRFAMTATTLTPLGTYREAFRPVVDGVTWMEDLGLGWDITIADAGLGLVPTRTHDFSSLTGGFVAHAAAASSTSTTRAGSSKPLPPPDRVITLPSLLVDAAAAKVKATKVTVDEAGSIQTGALEKVAAGDRLAVETTGFVAGEVVDVLVDGQAVATDQVITGDGATLLVTVPDDLPDGQHEVALRRITGQVAGATFRTGTNQAAVFIVFGLLLAVIGLMIWRRGRPPGQRRLVGSLLVVGVGLLILGSTDRLQATFEPIPVTQAIGQVYLPPGIEANHEYKNPLYQRWNMTTDTAWGTIGLVTMIERLAGDWKTLHPDEVLVISDMGLRGGGTFGSHTGEGHAQTRAADLWTWNPETQVSHVRTDADFIADYDPRYVREFNKLLSCLTNDRGYADDQLVVFFAPDEGVQWARTHGIDYDTDHAHHWHVEVAPQFQGPRVDSSACVDQARAAGQRTD